MEKIIKVIPNSKNPGVIEDTEKDGMVVVRVKEPAEKGKANKAVIKLLSKYFKVSNACVKIVSGAKSRKKIIEIIS